MGSPCGFVECRVFQEVHPFGVQAALLKHADAANARFGQSSARWRVLLHASGGGKSVSDIARATGDSRQAVQRLADDLVAEGFVRYLADESDGRKRRLELTEAATFGRIEAHFEGWSGRLLGRVGAVLDEDREHIINDKER